MTDSPWLDELKHQFDGRGLSLLLKETTGGPWIATAWNKAAPIRHRDAPVGRAEGATPREAALRLLMALDDEAAATEGEASSSDSGRGAP